MSRETQTMVSVESLTNRAEHGGEDKVDLVDYKRDQAVINICQTWAGDYDSSDALSKGFEVDDVHTGFADAVGDFKDELKATGKLT